MSAGSIAQPSFDVYAEDINGTLPDPWSASAPTGGKHAAVTS